LIHNPSITEALQFRLGELSVQNSPIPCTKSWDNSQHSKIAALKDSLIHLIQTAVPQDHNTVFGNSATLHPLIQIFLIIFPHGLDDVEVVCLKSYRKNYCVYLLKPKVMFLIAVSNT
jgi:hypothetical protein